MTTVPKSKKTESRSILQKQIREGKAVLRKLQDTLEDFEDRLELADAKKKNAGKPGTPLRDAAKELGLI